MKIAACDDNPILLKQIADLLAEYQLPGGQPIEYELFTSAVELMSSLESHFYDAIFLDIIMPGFSGMEAAHDIRTFNGSIKIIFLTSSPEYALESYRVHAYDYLLKPIDKQALFECLDRVSLSTFENTSGLTINNANKIATIPYLSIEYISVDNRILEFHLTDSSILKIYGHLKDYEDDILKQEGFVKVHRSYIVNFRHMRAVEDKDIITTRGELIPIARNLKKEIKESFFRYVTRKA